LKTKWQKGFACIFGRINIGMFPSLSLAQLFLFFSWEGSVGHLGLLSGNYSIALRTKNW